MKLNVRIIQFDILLVLNNIRVLLKMHQLLVKSKTKILQWLKEYTADSPYKRAL